MYYNGNEIKGLYYNGAAVQNAWYNGVQVWPTNEILSYRIYLEWDPVKDDNICIDGMWLNGSAMTTAMFEETPGTTSLDVSVNINGSWSTMATEDVEKMIANGTDSLQKYCRGITFRLKPDWGFESFSWKTDQYYAPTGYQTIEIFANGSEQSTIEAKKTINQNPNTTYTANRGDT